THRADENRRIQWDQFFRCGWRSAEELPREVCFAIHRHQQLRQLHARDSRIKTSAELVSIAGFNRDARIIPHVRKVEMAVLPDLELTGGDRFVDRAQPGVKLIREAL